jgi:hypothetical protein
MPKNPIRQTSPNERRHRSPKIFDFRSPSYYNAPMEQFSNRHVKKNRIKCFFDLSGTLDALTVIYNIEKFRSEFAEAVKCLQNATKMQGGYITCYRHCLEEFKGYRMERFEKIRGGLRFGRSVHVRHLPARDCI